jgi:hypothetical protein
MVPSKRPKLGRTRSELEAEFGRPLTETEELFLDVLDEDDGPDAGERNPPMSSKKTYTSGMFAPTAAWRGSTSSSRGRRDCAHYGHTVLYSTGDVQLYGARGSQLSPHAFDVVLDCANILTSQGGKAFVTCADPDIEARLNSRAASAYLRIGLSWPDGRAPDTEPSFWTELWAVLRSEAKRRSATPLAVVATCIGGHGRTGTCLASLMIADGMSASAAIEHVRSQHCTSAIETATQIQFLFELDKALNAATPSAADVEKLSKTTAVPSSNRMRASGDFDGIPDHPVIIESGTTESTTVGWEPSTEPGPVEGLFVAAPPPRK